jgi:hypothetical protein
VRAVPGAHKQSRAVLGPEARPGDRPALIPGHARPASGGLVVDGFGGEAVLLLEAGTLVDLVCCRLTLAAGTELLVYWMMP